MNNTMVNERPKIEGVVRSRQDLAGVQGLDGTYVSNERLGIGIIRDTRPNNEVLVHWVVSDVVTWMRPDEIELFDHDARVIAVYERDGGAGREFRRCKVVSRVGLNHNWSVELFPDDIVRTIRSDGSAWTFNWYPLYERAYPIHTLQDEPRTDDDAEAITVAEVAHFS